MRRGNRAQRAGGNRRGRICGAAAALLSAALFLFLFSRIQEDAGSREAAVLILGDSVMGEVRDQTAIPARLEALLGSRVYNAAFGGSCAARLKRGEPLDYMRGTFSLAVLAKALEAADFGVQQSAIMRESNTEYFGEVTDGLEELDFSRIPIFIIQQGINDYMAGVRIENPGDPYDEYTFLGALRTAVASVRKVNPTARIILVTPLFTWLVDTEETCAARDGGGGTLGAYVDGEIRLAAELGIEVIDLYHDFLPHEEWEDWKRYSRDGMHPNEMGREKIALKIAEHLREQQ